MVRALHTVTRGGSLKSWTTAPGALLLGALTWNLGCPRRPSPKGLLGALGCYAACPFPFRAVTTGGKSGPWKETSWPLAALLPMPVVGPPAGERRAGCLPGRGQGADVNTPQHRAP